MKPENKPPKQDNPYCGPGDHWKYGYRPSPKHWFFKRIFFLFLFLCLGPALIIFCLLRGNCPVDRIPHYLGWIFLIIAAGFFALRRMFGPLRWLMKGVEEISKGNLDFQLTNHRHHGEIGYLAETFNLMARRVKEMVESKSRLLLDVSHELRSPLTRMKVALEMTPNSKLKNSMMRDITEMETMLNEILETERLKGNNGKLSLTEVDLSALAREFALKYKTRKPGVKLMGKPKGLLVQVDESRVRTVIRNVLENALKYSSNQKKPVEMSLEEGTAQVLLSVKDFGVGISAADQEKIFEPFYRVDPSRTKDTGGYGLGLSLCREIMRAHCGEILLESEPGQGTRMILRFPKG